MREIDPEMPGPPLLALCFARGARPSPDDVTAAAERSGAYAVVHQPPSEEGWLEALITGLSFDVAGLAPQPPFATGPVAHRFDIAFGWRAEEHEAIVVRPGPHLAGGANMVPVVRGAVSLAAALSRELPVKAVVWIPAASVMSPAHFQNLASAWLAGGPFPALGLTGFSTAEDGSLVSDGLAFFTGQEVAVAASPRVPVADDAKLATRLVNHFVASGALTAPARLTGPDGEPLLAKPSTDGARVTVWRQT